MAITIDLNADLGEGAGADAALYPLISSASIACGGHAGDSESMRVALAACARHGVVAGAHPGFADREGFGRRRLDQSVETIVASVLNQVDTLKRIADREGTSLRYVKLHGALANMAAEDETLATAMFGPLATEFPELAMLAMAGTGQEKAARALGLVVVTEAYADRGYTAEGQLAPRDRAGGVLDDVDAVVSRCVRLAENAEIVAIDGTILTTRAQSICLHGDTPHAVAMAQAVSAGLRRIGTIASPLRQKSGEVAPISSDSPSINVRYTGV